MAYPCPNCVHGCQSVSLELHSEKQILGFRLQPRTQGAELGDAGFPFLPMFLLKAPIPIYLTTAKNRLKQTGVSVSVVSLKSFLNMFVGHYPYCFPFVYSQMSDVKQHNSLEAPRCVRSLPKWPAGPTTQNGSTEKKHQPTAENQAFSFASPFSWTKKKCHTKQLQAFRCTTSKKVVNVASKSAGETLSNLMEF